MRLVSLYEQRAIGATFSSIRSRKQLPFPSGAQFTESALESAVVDQLAFSPYVHDLITQLIVNFEHEGVARHYTADVFVEYRAPDRDVPERFMIESKRREDLEANADKYAIRLAAARTWCGRNDSAFCILDEADIKTTYLQNVRLLMNGETKEPPAEHRTLLQDVLGSKPSTFAETIMKLKGRGLSEPEARTTLEQAVISRGAACDLTKPFGDETLIGDARRSNVPMQADPFLRTLRTAAKRSRS